MKDLKNENNNTNIESNAELITADEINNNDACDAEISQSDNEPCSNICKNTSIDGVDDENITKTLILDNNDKKVKTQDDIDDPEPISEQQRIEDAFKNCPPDKCKRDNALDKKINNYGTGVAIVMFLIAIVISIFNMKSMRFPISFLFLGLGAAAMAATAYIRRRNNIKCGCSVCKTQSKTLFTTSILYGILAIAGVIVGIVMMVI